MNLKGSIVVSNFFNSDRFETVPAEPNSTGHPVRVDAFGLVLGRIQNRTTVWGNCLGIPLLRNHPSDTYLFLLTVMSFCLLDKPALVDKRSLVSRISHNAICERIRQLVD